MSDDPKQPHPEAFEAWGYDRPETPAPAPAPSDAVNAAEEVAIAEVELERLELHAERAEQREFRDRLWGRGYRSRRPRED